MSALTATARIEWRLAWRGHIGPVLAAVALAFFIVSGVATMSRQMQAART